LAPEEVPSENPAESLSVKKEQNKGIFLFALFVDPFKAQAANLLCEICGTTKCK